MTIEILADAQADLISGFRFYERQRAGLGRYFIDCLSADIELLAAHAGIHAMVSDITAASANASRSRSITVWAPMSFVFAPFWIVEENRLGYGDDCRISQWPQR